MKPVAPSIITGVEENCFMGGLPFLSPNQQHQSTERLMDGMPPNQQCQHSEHSELKNQHTKTHTNSKHSHNTSPTVKHFEQITVRKS